MMKKLFFFIALLLPIGVWADETIIAEQDWTGPYEFLDEGTDATTQLTAEGLALINPRVQYEIWTPQTVICRGITLKKDHDYTVRINLKVPSNGTYQVVLGSWESSMSHEVPVKASDDWQEIDISYKEYAKNIGDGHITFQNGFVKGTTIIQNVQVIDNTHGEEVIAEKDWNSPYAFWSYEGTGATCKMVAAGVSITNPRVQDELGTPQTMVLKGATIQKNHSYRVGLWAKIPSDGQLQVNMTGDQTGYQYDIPVQASNDFQWIEFTFYDITDDQENVCVLFQNGKIKGTSIVKYVEIVDLGNVPVPLKYKYNPENNTAEVIKDPDRKYKEAVVIPSTVTHNGKVYTVTGISGDAFSDCINLTSITIPATVTNIEGSSFANCASLQTIIVDPANTVYDSRNNCNAIIEKASNKLIVGCETTVIPNGVSSIGSWAFWGRWGLKTIAIPNTVKTIGDAAFSWCFIESVTLPSSLEAIEGWAFQFTDLKSITLPASLKSLGQEAFRNCENLESIAIPEGIEEIPDSCFKYCKSLTTVNYGKVKKIGGGAFASTALTNVKLPNTVKELGHDAFARSPIQTLDLGKVERIGWCAFISTAIKELTIPATLIEAGGETFSWNFSMKKVTFQEGCTKVFDTMFHGNENLSEVILPNTITEIENRAFQSCAKLENVAWPNKLERIGEQAFRLSGITSAVLPKTMKWIGNQAFQYCNQLAGYVDLSYIEHLGYNAFSDCPLITMTSIPPTIVIDENSWAAFSPSGLETVEFFEGTTIIDNLTFAGCENLKNLPYGLPSTLERIGHNAFSECKSLESITIPKNVNWIQEEAFSGCSKLASVVSKIQDPTQVNLEENVFTGIAKNAVLYVPKGTINAYTQKGWTKFFANVKEEPNNTLYPKDLSTRAGNQPTLNITMDNDVQITAMQFDLVLPKGITVASNEDGLIVTLGSRAAASHTIAKRVQPDEAIRIVCSSNSSAVFSGNKGSVIFAKLNISNDLADGEYTVTIKNIELSSKDGVAFHPNQTEAKITVGGVIMGDVDSNGSVTVNDAVWIVRDILGTTPTGFVKAAADLDGNGNVTVNDKVVLINRYILGKNVASTRAAIKDNSTLSIADLSMQPGETRTVNVMMSTDRTDIEALQCDIYLPQGLTFVAKEVDGETFYAEKGERATNSHNVSSYIQEDGALRVVESNDEGTAFRQNDKAVFSFTVKASDDVKIGNHTIRLANMELSYGTPINPADVKSTVTITVSNLGDVNNNGSVDKDDINALAKLIMSGTYNARADMNKDGKVNATDLVLLTNIVNGK